MQKKSPSSRAFDNLNKVLRTVETTKKTIIEKNLIKELVKVSDLRSIKFLPLIYSSALMSKTVFAQLFSDKQKIFLCERIDPLVPSTLTFLNIPLLKETLRKFQLKHDFSQILQRFDPVLAQDDGYVFLRALFHSLRQTSDMKRSRHFLLYILLYMSVKSNGCALLKMFCKGGFLAHMGIKGKQLVLDGILIGEKRGSGFADLKCNIGLAQQWKKVVSLKTRSKALYYRHFGYSLRELKQLK